MTLSIQLIHKQDHMIFFFLIVVFVIIVLKLLTSAVMIVIGNSYPKFCGQSNFFSGISDINIFLNPLSSVKKFKAKKK